MKENSFILDYYVCHDKKSEFLFIAIQDVRGFCLQKKFLNDTIFPKYEEIAKKIKD